MKAIVMTGYGDTSVLDYRTIPIPTPGPGEAQIQVLAISINPYEGYNLRGTFGRGCELPCTIGGDLCGKISSLGLETENCGFAVGDLIVTYFNTGGWKIDTGVTAQFICTPVKRLVKKPGALTVEKTATLPCAALTALTAVNHGKVSEGKTVAIIGSSGGVGCFVTALSRVRVGDAGKVIGVCSAAKADFVSACGATAIVDYNGDLDAQFAALGKVDVLIDCYGHGSCSLYPKYVKVDDPNAAIITIADWEFSKPEDWSCVFTRFALPSDDESSRSGLEEICRLFEDGSLAGLAEVVATRVFEWEEYAQAHEAIASGHTMGKLVIKVPPV